MACLQPVLLFFGVQKYAISTNKRTEIILL